MPIDGHTEQGMNTPLRTLAADRWSRGVLASLVLAQLAVGIGGLEAYPFSDFSMFAAVRETPHRSQRFEIVGYDADGQELPAVMPGTWRRPVWAGIRKHPDQRDALLRAIAETYRARRAARGQDSELARLELRMFMAVYPRPPAVGVTERVGRTLAAVDVR